MIVLYRRDVKLVGFCAQMMAVMPAAWPSLAPDERRGRRLAGSLLWSSSRKPRWGRRSNMRSSGADSSFVWFLVTQGLFSFILF